MKKLLVISLFTVNILSMDDTYSRGIEIPGAIKPSQESHSPVASSGLLTSHSLHLERLANQYAEKIRTAGLEYYHTLVARGFAPGSVELTNLLLEDHQRVLKQLAANDKQTSPRIRREKSEPVGALEAEGAVHELSLSTNACALHIAAVINAGIAFHLKTNKS